MLPAGAHALATNSRLNCFTPTELHKPFYSPKDEIWFLSVCHLIPTAL